MDFACICSTVLDKYASGKNGIFAPKTLINLVINSFSNVLSYDIFDFSIHAAETGKKYHLGTRIIIRKSILYIISLSKP